MKKIQQSKNYQIHHFVSKITGNHFLNPAFIMQDKNDINLFFLNIMASTYKRLQVIPYHVKCEGINFKQKKYMITKQMVFLKTITFTFYKMITV